MKRALSGSVRWLVLGALLVSPVVTGCTMPQRAFPYASVRSGCDQEKIQVVRSNGSSAVLDVCGTHEDWRWTFFNGYEYVGPSAEQPAAAARPAAAVDSDGDGVPDDHDACPHIAGPAGPDPQTNGCPPASDSDGDGVPDATDACRTVPGVASDVPQMNGCPPDGDEDGIPDGGDACPAEAGPAHSDPAMNGCPPRDQDGDGVLDADDACVAEAGVVDSDPARNGCPPAVARIDGDSIVLGKPIVFEDKKSKLLPESDEVLDAVAALLAAHPEVLQIEIGVHTDAQGEDWFNRNLSRERARVVALGLIKRGVKERQVRPQGYGATQLLAEGDGEDAHAKNRRVELKILKRQADTEG